MNYQFLYVGGAAGRLDTFVCRQAFSPLQDFQLVLPVVLGNEEPDVAGRSFLSTDRTHIHCYPVHMAPFMVRRDDPRLLALVLSVPVRSPNANGVTFLFPVCNGTVIIPRAFSNVRVSREQHSSHSQ